MQSNKCLELPPSATCIKCPLMYSSLRNVDLYKLWDQENLSIFWKFCMCNGEIGGNGLMQIKSFQDFLLSVSRWWYHWCIFLTDYTRKCDAHALRDSEINFGRSEILDTMWLPRVISPRCFTFCMDKFVSMWREMTELSIDSQDDLVPCLTMISGWISPEQTIT